MDDSELARVDQDGRACAALTGSWARKRGSVQQLKAAQQHLGDQETELPYDLTIPLLGVSAGIRGFRPYKHLHVNARSGLLIIARKSGRAESVYPSGQRRQIGLSMQ